MAKGPAVQDEAIELLRRLVALRSQGHRYRPIGDKDRPILEAANREAGSDDRRYNLDCWDCDQHADKRWSDDMTFGDYHHEKFEAFAAARAFLEGLG